MYIFSCFLENRLIANNKLVDGRVEIIFITFTFLVFVSEYLSSESCGEKLVKE